jgi:hypothetical protein
MKSKKHFAYAKVLVIVLYTLPTLALPNRF